MVFAVTATFSVFAYVWLLIILMWSSPNVVELWEAILTFVFFPILVLIAYAADKGWIHKMLCMSPQSSANDKQRQIELGNFQPGESMYQFPLFPLLPDPCNQYHRSTLARSYSYLLFGVATYHNSLWQMYYYYHLTPFLVLIGLVLTIGGLC